MTITWVVAADLTDAKIYALGQVKGELVLIKEFKNPEGRYKTGDIGFDKPGQFEKPMHGFSKSFEHPDPKTVELHQFAKIIAHMLEHSRTQNEFNHLIIVAEPHFHGILAHELNPHVASMIKKNIQRNYLRLSASELYAHVIE